jgi:hypothetical protein
MSWVKAVVCRGVSREPGGIVGRKDIKNSLSNSGLPIPYQTQEAEMLCSLKKSSFKLERTFFNLKKGNRKHVFF